MYYETGIMSLKMNNIQENTQFLLETQAELAMLPLMLPESPEMEAEARDRRITDDNIDAAKGLPVYITNFIGSKQKLTDWIWLNTPEGVKSVLDAFSGSAVVGYMYKQKGLRVVCNDRLRYCHHIARAIVENQKVTLSEDDLKALLKTNPKAGSFVQETFRGKFFQIGVHALIDNIRANIDALSGFKKDLALFMLGKTCISSAGSFGHFQSANNKGTKDRYPDTPKEFIERFKQNVERINGLVFNNEQDNKAYRKDILDIFDEVKVDLAYFDPPYATQFSTTNYETSYHFIEGLMTYWKGLEIDEGSKVRKYKTEHQTVTQANAEVFFDNVFEKAKGIKYWIISYRDKAYPNERKMKELIDKHGKASRMKSHEHTYSLGGTNREGEASHGKERLFICGPAGKKSSADVEDDMVMESDPLVTVVDVFFQPSLIADSNPEGIDEEMTAEAVKDTGQFIANFMGSKRKLMSWIWAHTPEGVETALDLFSGGANVAYYYKKKGLKVIANDLLKYPYHIARAVVENSSVIVSDDDIETLLSENKSVKNFIVKNFHGYYYTKQILEFLDNTYANIQMLSGYKKDIALFALGATCKAKTSFGEFHRSKKALTRPLSEYPSLEKHKGSQLGNIPLPEFKESFVRYIKHANSLVFDNGKECKAYNREALALLPEVKADVVYADPPYVTEFNANDYEADNHFVEGLMTCWQGKKLIDNHRKDFESRTKYNKASIAKLIKGFIEGVAKMGAHLLMSYRDHAFPTSKELQAIMAERFGEVDLHKKSVQYTIGIRSGSKHDAKEYLFVASKPRKGKAAAAEDELAPPETPWDWNWGAEANGIIDKFGWAGLAKACAYVKMDYPSKEHDGKYPVAKQAYFLPYRKIIDGKLMVVWRGVAAAMASLNGARGGVKLSKEARKQAYEVLLKWYEAFEREAPPLKAEADCNVNRNLHAKFDGEILLAEAGEGEEKKDPTFTFILTHAGANKNGDYFLPEELKSNHGTAVNSKIDFQHSQNLTDIVGGVIDSKYVESEGGYVECVGSLFIHDSPAAKLAYKLVKQGIVSQVSMECEFAEGECSICGKRSKSKSDYCVHLRQYKGRQFRGEMVYQKLHDIVFTGCGLLDRKGADPGAVIKSVANTGMKSSKKLIINSGDLSMDANATFRAYLEAQKVQREIWPMTNALEGYLSGILKKFSDEAISGDELIAKANECLSSFSAEMKAMVDALKGASTAKAAVDEDELKRFKEENETLKKQLADLQKKVDEYEAEKAKSARKVKATELVTKWEQRGKTFESEEARTAEIERLAGLDDSALAATEKVIEQLKPSGGGGNGNKPKSEAGDKGALRTDAGVEPEPVDDGKTSPEERLAGGLQKARQDLKR